MKPRLLILFEDGRSRLEFPCFRGNELIRVGSGAAALSLADWLKGTGREVDLILVDNYVLFLVFASFISAADTGVAKAPVLMLDRECEDEGRRAFLSQSVFAGPFLFRGHWELGAGLDPAFSFALEKELSPERG